MDGSVGAWEPPAALGEDHARALSAADSASDTLALDAAAAAHIRQVMNADGQACAKLDRTKEGHSDPLTSAKGEKEVLDK